MSSDAESDSERLLLHCSASLRPVTVRVAAEEEVVEKKVSREMVADQAAPGVVPPPSLYHLAYSLLLIPWLPRQLTASMCVPLGLLAERPAAEGWDLVWR